MKRKRLALLLAAALTVTSVDGTAFAVSGAELSSEPVEEAEADEAVSETEEEQAEAEQPEEETEELTDSGDVSGTEELTPDAGEVQDSQGDSGEIAAFSSGEEAAFSAGETGSSIIPDTMTELSLDQDYDVNITMDKSDAWFSFTSQEDGEYIFSSSNESMSTPVCFGYDRKDVTDRDDYLFFEEGDGSNNFRCTFNAKAGTTYYFCVASYDDEAAFSVRLQKKQAPVSAQVNTDKLERTTFIPGIDPVCLPQLELNVRYSDGTSQTVSFSSYSYYAYDRYGNEITYGFRSSVQDDTYTAGETMPSGTANLVLFCNGSEISLDAPCSFEVKVPDSLPELHAGTGNTIESGELLYTWYTFTAPKTAEYTISPVNSVAIYTRDGRNNVNRYDLSGKSVVSLEKGVTYYMGFCGLYYDEETGRELSQWDVAIEEKEAISSVAFSEKELTFTETLVPLTQYDQVGTLTVNYSNGNTPDSVKVRASGTSYDRYGNEITAQLTDNSTGNEIIWDDGYLNLPAGSYTLKFFVGSEAETAAAEVPVTVKKPVFDDYTRLTMGKNQIRTSSYDEPEKTYYGFEAEKDGEYLFGYNTDEKMLSAYWYRFNDEGNLEWFDPEYDKYGLRLSKGRYIVYWNDEYYGSEAEITVKYIPEITSVKVRSLKSFDSVIEEGSGNAFLKELTVEVTCADGTTEELKYDSENEEFPKDEYGRELFYTFTHCKDESGKYPEVEDPNNLTAGDYVYRVSAGGVFAEDTPFKVVSREEAVTKELTEGDTELKNQTSLLLKYKAAAAGRYELKVNIPVTELRIRKSDNTEAENVAVEEYRAYAGFEKGETYYIYVRADEYCPELKVTVSALTRPESMETTTLKKNYIAGLDYFYPSYVQTRVSSAEGKTRVIRGTGNVEGYGLNYRVEDSKGKAYTGEEPLTVGTWTVTPYLSASVQTGSAIAIDMSKIPVKSDTIVAKKMDLTALPALNTDSWTEIKDDISSEQYYAFTAKEDGTYQLVNEGDEFVYGNLYSDEMEGYRLCSGNRITLKKGESCLAVLFAQSGRKYKIVKKSASTEDPGTTETPEKLTELPLTVGMNKLVSCEKNGISCTFTPEEDGYYRLETSAWGEEWTELRADLYCGDEILTSYKDGSTNTDIIWKLEKGKKYVYRITPEYEESGVFYVSFRKQDTAEIRDMEFVKSEEFVPGESDTVLRYVNDSYKLKITYDNGTTDIVNIWDDFDKYGNRLNWHITRQGSALGESVTYKVAVEYQALWENESSHSKELSIQIKGLAVFARIEAEKDYTVNAESQYYCFTPSEDGKYIVSMDADVINSGIEIWSCEDADGYLERSYLSDEDEGRNTYSVEMKAGKTYLIGSWTEKDSTAAIRIQKVKKTLKGLELVKVPDQKTCIPNNDIDQVSLKGLQLKAFYTDGSTEIINYGNTDSSGRKIYLYETKWLADGSCTVYVNLGKYQTSFHLAEGSLEDVPEIKTGQKMDLEAELGDMITLKFVPAYSGFYRAEVENGFMNGYTIRGAADDCSYWKGCQLKAGKTYYFQIRAMGKKLSITMNGICDEHKWDAGKVTKAATCKDEGVKTYTCTNCGTTRTETIAKSTEHKWDGGKVTKAATCKEEGSRTYTCSICGATKTEAIAKTTDHKWDAGKVTKEAACETDGEMLYTCTVCGATRTESIAKTGHKFGSWIKVSGATIKEKQKEKRTCSLCGVVEYTETGSLLKPSIKLNVKSITIQEKQTTQAVKVTMAKGDSVKSWSSSNKKIVTVDQKGKIRGVKKGTARITVMLASDKKASVTVKVQEKKITTSKITGLKSTVSMVRGNTVTLKPVLSPITSQDKITYSTSNKNIAAVSSKGVITGKKAGTAKITVKAGKKKAVVTVKVTPKVKTTKLTGVPKAKTVSKGKTFTIKAVAAPKNTEEKITYKSSNSKIATVTSKGVVKGIKKGTATITVQSGSKKQTCKVTVK